MRPPPEIDSTSFADRSIPVGKRVWLQPGKRLAAVMLLALVSSSGPAAAQQTPAAPAAAAWYASYARDSHLVRLPGGRSLNLYCVGAGSPTAILESGIGGGAYDWRSVQARMAERTRVCAYDRAGLGRSPPGPLPRDTRAEVADLEALVRAAGLRPPYLLVGHSMGGYNVRLFASRHRRDVAGILLIDPSVENQLPILYAAVPALAASDQRQIGQLRACADPQRSAEMVARCARSAPEGFPPELAASFVAEYGLTAAQTVLSEVDSFLTVASQQVIAERRRLGAMPLIVLTRGERSGNLTPDQAETEWTLWHRLHGEVARLSTIGSHRVVEGANHYIQLDRPDAVIDAVGELVAAARRRR
jgi:pimeloyl-ACP methyl ester carboxylesterase